MAATGLGKALDLPGFVAVLQTYQMGVADAVLWLAAPCLAALEIALGLWILSGRRLTRAMWVSVALNAGYFALLASALLRGLGLPNCGCFGAFFARPLRWYSPLEDLGLIVLSLVLLALVTGTLRARASLTIRAPGAKVMAIYRDIALWPRMFPTIRAVRLLRDEGEKQVIEVDHRQAGRVINVLQARSRTAVELAEFKPRYDARFVNRFEGVPGGTRYTVFAEIRPNGFWKLVAGPWLKRHVRTQIARLVLEPVRRFAESAPG